MGYHIFIEKWLQSCWLKQWAMCGGAPYCINIVVLSHHLAWKARIMDYFDNEVYSSSLMVHVTLLVVWNKCTADISVTTESSPCIFLHPDLLDAPTWILPAIGCEDISSSWSIMIPSHLYPTLKKALNFMRVTLPSSCCLRQSNMRFYASRW